jgi:hypothetical protein
VNTAQCGDARGRPAALVGRTVRVGEAKVELIRDNPPCTYLQELTGKPVVTGLRGNGGTRGRIVAGGLLRVGDGVVAVDDRQNQVPQNGVGWLRTVASNRRRPPGVSARRPGRPRRQPQRRTAEPARRHVASVQHEVGLGVGRRPGAPSGPSSSAKRPPLRRRNPSVRSSINRSLTGRGGPAEC